MVTTAERETWRPTGRQSNHLSLSLSGERDTFEWELGAPHDQFAIWARLSEALDALASVHGVATARGRE